MTIHPGVGSYSNGELSVVNNFGHSNVVTLDTSFIAEISGLVCNVRVIG
jgi:hypothetical protein